MPSYAFGMPPHIKDTLYRVYADAKRVLYEDLPPGFLPGALVLETTAADRKDYVLHPPKGLILDAIAKGRARGQGQMPAGLVDGQDAQDVAAYVAAVAGHG